MADAGEVPFFEQRHAGAYSILAGTARALDLGKRLPPVLKARGWPEDPDLYAVLGASVCLCYRYAGRTRMRRPQAADGCGGKWPTDKSSLTAREVVDTLDLAHLLET